jgi:hypothetical protein
MEFLLGERLRDMSRRAKILKRRGMKRFVQRFYPIEKDIIDSHPHERPGALALANTSLWDKGEWGMGVVCGRCRLGEVAVIASNLVGILKVVLSGIVGCDD